MDTDLSAYELKNRWNKKSIKLFNLSKKGILYPYTWSGKKVVNPDLQPKGRKEILDRIKSDLRIEEGSNRAGVLMKESEGTYERPLTADEFEREAQRRYNAQPLNTPNIPPGCIEFDYNLPDDDIKAKQIVDKFMEFYFKESDIKKCEIDHGLFKPKKDAEELGQTPNDIIEKKVFPCGLGTKWEEVKITLTSFETVRIETPLGKEIFSYHELEMSNKRNNKPTVLWTVLMFLAKNHGKVTAEDMEYHDDRERLFSASKRLNKRLQKVFGINGSIYKWHYNKHKRYETKIFFSDQTVVIQEADDLEKNDDSITSIIDKEIEEKKSLPSKKSKDYTYR